MAKPKQRAAKRSPKAAKPAAKAVKAKAVKAKPVKKTAARPLRKAPVKAAKTAKPRQGKVRAAAPAARPVKPAARKAAQAPHARTRANKPAAAASTRQTHAHGARAHAHGAAAQPVVRAPAPVRKPVPARPAGGVAARLNVAAVDEQTLTREDGRYALPATVNIDLPKDYHPNDKEEYMGPRQLAYFRQKLKSWRDQLVEESRQTMENLRGEVRDVGDDAERATRETENSLELRTRDRYRKLISKIEKALRKIEEGRYGYCEETDEEIGLERLEARPIAVLSLDAQERREHLQKQMGD